MVYGHKSNGLISAKNDTIGKGNSREANHTIFSSVAHFSEELHECTLLEVYLWFVVTTRDLQQEQGTRIMVSPS